MAKKDLYHNIGVVHLLDAQDILTSDTKSKILDLAGFEGALILVNVGAITTPDSNSYITPVLQESDTVVGTDFTDVAAADILGGYTKMDATTEDQVTQVAGYIGSKRYIQVNIDITDGDGGISHALVSVDGIVGFPIHKPVSAPAAVTAT